MTTSVVVTGLGTVGPAGPGAAALSASLRAGRAPFSEVDRSAGYHVEGSARSAGLLPPNAFEPWLASKDARRMSPSSRMAVCAGAMALDAAGFTRERFAGADAGVCLGTAFGSTGCTARLLEQVHAPGPLAISPFLFMETVASAHAGQMALAFGARGPNYTVSQREASGCLAVARGADLVARGRAARVLVGVVDEVSAIQHAVLDRFRALARPEAAGEPEVARVLDARRAGFLVSEGATVWVLEEESAARARGAPLVARVRASVRANDKTASGTDWGDGFEVLAQRLAAGLERADVDPRSFDRIVSGANGSRRGDRIEALTLRAFYGDDRLPPILAPKSVTGEYGGGFLAAALLALGAETWAAAPGFERPDPELGVVPHDGSPLEPARRILVSSLSAGGAAAWLVLEGLEP